MHGCSQRRVAVLTVAAALLLPASALGAGHPRLAISPAPGTPDVNPATQISILGPPAAAIRSVKVTGEASGPHPGELQPYSGDRGASFVLDDPLTAEENVHVVVRVRGYATRRFSFTVAHLGPPQPPLILTATQPDKLHHWQSRPDLEAPYVAVTKSAPVTHHDGKLLITPLPSPVVHPESNNSISIHPVGPGGPMIANRKGQIVWFKQLEPPGKVAANLRVQRYHGHRVLTWWQGTVTPTAFGVGEGVIADHSYRVVKKVQAGNGYPMDIHEFTLTPSGDALFTVYSPILVHLPGTPDGKLSPLMDAIAQEVDIKTGLVIWEWHAYGHIPLSQSYANPANSASFDAFHLNSLQSLGGGGHVLISARDTQAVYDVERATGKILWRLGGKKSTFSLDSGAEFHFQHDAQLLPGGRVSLFDDEGGPPQTAPSSRGLILGLDTDSGVASLQAQFLRRTDTPAQSEGSVQTLPSGRIFVGFGSQPAFSEFSPSGKLLFDGTLPQDDGSYRDYREHWSAHPHTRPAVVATAASNGTDTVSASWNGATAVGRWRVLGGPDPDSLHRVTVAKRRGFETSIDVPTGSAYYAVQALGARGHVQATSVAVPVH